MTDLPLPTSTRGALRRAVEFLAVAAAVYVAAILAVASGACR